ncbi:MAG: hypothetical protein PHN84_12325 [Desulfuromonadaceae bacterium]|nr:hypothetical protein [Desulfuromonadaceae bacterium]MDD2856185.1 hypothetical protein [Desulfuromonadaceae bacterium]
MFRYLIAITSFLLFTQSLSWGVEKSPVFTQKDFASLILQQFSWNEGLPKDSTDRDYYSILGGKRNFRYEAENAYNPETDRVTIRDFPIYGSFTGKGWILGVSDTTFSTFTILVPIAGEYDFKAVMKGKGFVWEIDGKEYHSDSKSDKFEEIAIGKFPLKSGTITVKLTIPPEGAIDSFSLTAPDYTPVKPFNGWRFKDPVTAVRMAEVAVSLTNSYEKLPDAPKETFPAPLAVAEKCLLPATALLTDAAYLGRFSASKWVRADFRGTSLKFPITIAEAGYYRLMANVMGETVSGSVNDTPFKLTGKQYLSKLDLGLYRLESGENIFTIVLPPAGGIDTIQFIKKSSKADDFLALATVSGPEDRLIDEKEATKLLKDIQGAYSIRK